MVGNPTGKNIYLAGNFSVGSPMVQVIDHAKNLRVGITAGQIVDPSGILWFEIPPP